MKHRIIPFVLTLCCVIGLLLVWNGVPTEAATVDSTEAPVSEVAKTDNTIASSTEVPSTQSSDTSVTETAASEAVTTTVEPQTAESPQNSETTNTTVSQNNVTKASTSEPTAPLATQQDATQTETQTTTESTPTAKNTASSETTPQENKSTISSNETQTTQDSTQTQSVPNVNSVQDEQKQQSTLRAAQQPNAQTTQANTDTRTILHTNDMHGRIVEEDGRVIGMPKLKTIKEQAQPDLMVDAGDAFQGLPLSNQSKGEEMAKAMNAVGYDAMTAGNHEFDFGYDQLKKLESMLNFPIVSSNVYKDGELAFKPSVIIEKNGMKYGIVGVTTPETQTKTRPEGIKGVTFEDPLTSVTREMNRLNGQVDTFVILSHLGIDETTKKEWRGDYLTEQLSQNQNYNVPIFVIDGHSHTVLQNGETFGSNLLAQTGTALANVGKITFDHNGTQIDNAKASLISVKDTTNIQPDAALQKQVDNANQAYLKATSEVIIPNNTIDFMGERDAVRTGETNLGNAIADAMESYGQTGFSHPSDFAVTNSGGIRASLGKGEVTLNDIITVLPFGNTIAQIQVKGSDVLKAFEHSLGAQLVEKDGQKQLAASGGLLQISNSIRVYYDMNLEPGQRIHEIQVLNKDTKQYEPLDLNRTYYVATNDFTASGGDGYDMLIGPREEGVSLDKVFAEYLKEADLSQYDTTEPVRMINGLPESSGQTSSEDTSSTGGSAIEENGASVGKESQRNEPTVPGKPETVPQHTTSDTVVSEEPNHVATHEPTTKVTHGTQSQTSNVIPITTIKTATGTTNNSKMESTTDSTEAPLEASHPTIKMASSDGNSNHHSQATAASELPATGTTETLPLGLGLTMIGVGTLAVSYRRKQSQKQ
ncbi:5'-nucleotidase C-terminal domain-containing protein [Staphylococcus canis]|uniref:LPXTG cell wall anchor domain-containing protein n=1 Tax=Staphylococcus canis TaxID=2724942 RepID=A0ABS0T6M8_9STAP|nr:5'-nucleotidase C-terminal domain-containing protein [Staphylococcus canis]MBI5974337.1 LPXTG cell wall anchor domain-containing protein [Staphylococcus canis]